MKISLKSLSEFFPTAGKDLLNRADMLRVKLPLAGLEIGATKKLGEGLEDIRVGQILSFEKHPQADRLNVCQVATGEKTLQIVCGAPNVKAGVKVALAPIGAVLPGDFKIKESSIRGVTSYGMLCSEKELGLSEESNGILHLPDTAPVGSPLVKALGLNDEVWEIELTPDRADCLSHLGMAREVGRLLGTKPGLPDFDILNPSDSGDVPLISVEVQAAKACPIYSAQLFEGIENCPVPDWLKRYLEALGQRSLGTVVDVTNFVLMELGHPLHAFDADKVTGARLIVRFAKNGEKLLTLDAVERVLTSEDLIIADLEKPLALAGVMGGAESAVTDKTKRVLLESALFEPDVVRAMSLRHKIHSEASHRFERGVDASGVTRSAGRVSLLLKQLCNARRRGAYIYVKSEKGERLLAKNSLNFDLRSFKDWVGIETSADNLVSAFRSVGIESQVKSTNVLRVEIPTHRLDLVREVDLIEEAARLIGYDQIPTRYPVQTSTRDGVTSGLYRRLRQTRQRLIECGLTEMMPYAFISDKEKAFLKTAELVQLKNPLSQDWLYMRPNLFFGLLQVLKRHAGMNQSRGTFFDTGSVFQSAKDLQGERQTSCREAFHIGWAHMGRRADDHWSTDKKSTERKAQADFFDAKGVAEQLLPSLATLFESRWNGAQFVALDEVSPAEITQQAPWIPVELLHPGRSALIVWPAKPPGSIVGYIGELHPLYKADLLNLPTGLELGAVVGELRLVNDQLALAQKLAAGEAVFPELRPKPVLSRRLPIVERDFAFVVKNETKESEIEKVLKQSFGAELLELKCLDLYPMSDEKKSLAFRVSLQGLEKTLSDEEIQKFCNKALDSVKQKFGAELRS